MATTNKQRYTAHATAANAVQLGAKIIQHLSGAELSKEHMANLEQQIGIKLGAKLDKKADKVC